MTTKRSAIGVLATAVLAFSILSADTVKPNGCKGPTLCDSRPVIDGCGWHIDIGLIAEQVRISNSAVYSLLAPGGSTGEQTFDNPATLSTITSVPFDLQAGLRVGLGYTTENEDWSINSSFEWLSSKGSVKDESETVASFFAMNYPFIFYPGESGDVGFSQANASIYMNYYLLDVLLSRGSFFSEKFSFEPLAGIKASWIGYNTSVRFSKDQNTSSGVPTGTSWLRRAVNSFWGVGPAAGMNANYHITQGWSIFSSSNFSLLLGEANVQDANGFVTTEAYPFSNGGVNKVAVVCPTLRSIFGLQYEMDTFEETQHVTFRFGFDGRYYFNQYPIISRVAGELAGQDTQQLVPHPSIISTNGLGMIGFVLDLGWDY